MWKTESSITTNKTLEEIFSKLKLNPDINAILLMGSAATQTAHAHSDYDLACIVRNLPKNMLGINTFIGDTFTEIFFYTPEEAEQLLQQEIVNPDKKEGWLINWSRDGQIIVDKSGLLKRIKEQSNTVKEDVADALSYNSWHKINYNFVQNMRYFHSGKGEYLQALDIRLLYSILEVIVGYFNVRKIPWRGEKLAIQWLKENDVEFLELFQSYLIEVDRGKKMELYEMLVKKSLEPIGGIWKDNVTSVLPVGDYGEETIKAGLLFWQRLLNNHE